MMSSGTPFFGGRANNLVWLGQALVRQICKPTTLRPGTPEVTARIVRMTPISRRRRRRRDGRSQIAAGGDPGVALARVRHVLQKR